VSFQVPSVICVACGAVLFRCAAVGRDFIGATLDAGDFTPVADDVPAPKNGDPLLCPKCGEVFVLEGEYGVILKLEEGSWWPHPPIDRRRKGLTHGS